MKKKWVIGFVVLVILAIGFVAISGGRRARAANAEVEPTLAPVKADPRVRADGAVVPGHVAQLSLPTGGVVAELLVSEGQAVSAGQALLRLDAARQRANVAQAEAGLQGARARVEDLEKGARQQEVDAAQATLMAAEARLAQLKAGPRAETIATAQAAVEVARAGVQTAQGALASAQANLAALQAGAAPEEIGIAERQIEQAKNALWGAQCQRDSICGHVDRGVSQGDCDAANAGVQASEEDVLMAELRLQQLRGGARQPEIAAAQAQVLQARGQLATAQAQVAQAEANLAQASVGATAEEILAAEAEVRGARANLELVQAGASPETIAVARAEVAAAQAVLAQAQVALDEATLRAPFGGTVARLSVEAGELVAAGAPVVRLADLNTWQVETSDLTELGVVNIAEGNVATMTFDAIPDLTLTGAVSRIKPIGENLHGDIIYTVIVALDQQDARLRWNMTVSVAIEPNA